MTRSHGFHVFKGEGRFIGAVAAIIAMMGTMVLVVATPAANAAPVAPGSRLLVPNPALIAASHGGALPSHAAAPAVAGNWTQVNDITGASEGGLGWSIAVSGGTMVVGAPFDNSGIGAAYVYTGSGTSWTQVAELTPSNGVADDFFGSGVAIKSGQIVVGALCHSASANYCTGAAYVFTGSGATWHQQAELDDPGQATNDVLRLSCDHLAELDPGQRNGGELVRRRHLRLLLGEPPVDR